MGHGLFDFFGVGVGENDFPGGIGVVLVPFIYIGRGVQKERLLMKGKGIDYL